MKVTYLPMGNQKFSLKRVKVLYSKEVPDTELILGYVGIKSLCFQRSLIDGDHAVVIGDRTFAYANTRTKKMKQTLGYLAVKDQTGKISYLGLCHSRRPLFNLGISALMSTFYFLLSASVLAAGAAVITSVLVIKEYTTDTSTPTKVEASTGDLEKPITKDITVHSPDEQTIVTPNLIFPNDAVAYNGVAITNDSSATPIVPDVNSFIAPLYSKFQLRPGESIPLVNVKENDVILQYVITDESNKEILNCALKPDAEKNLYNWIPNLSKGTHKLVMNINVFSLDQKSQFIGRTYDVIINITN